MPRTAWLSILGLYNWDKTVLDGLSQAPVDVGTLRDRILMECAELEIVYPDPDFCKTAIALWANSRKDAWERINTALSAEYDPIHNFDRHEEYEDNREGSVDGTSTNRVTAYNNTDFTDRAQDEGTSTSRDRLVHTAHLYGNIGVTRTQEMIADEIRLRQADLYSIIVEEFKQRFCILVY